MRLTTPQELLDFDSRLHIDKVSATPSPQKTAWVAMHQCYYEGFALHDPQGSRECEEWFGTSVINNCLAHGHFGVIEHPHIVLNVSGFPHDVMQQLRTHRHLSFDVQSGRYTSKRFCDEHLTVEDVYWLRPPGTYRDRESTPLYEYTKEWRESDIINLAKVRGQYNSALTLGMSPEHARQAASFGFRQNFVFSGNLRAMLHLLMLRNKKDVQLETQAFSLLLLERLREWAPEITTWWETKGVKLRLAP